MGLGMPINCQYCTFLRNLCQSTQIVFHIGQVESVNETIVKVGKLKYECDCACAWTVTLHLAWPMRVAKQWKADRNGSGSVRGSAADTQGRAGAWTGVLKAVESSWDNRHWQEAHTQGSEHSLCNIM